MGTHDPRQVIEELRNNLAVHDRPLTFLFGAGTSCSVNTSPPARPGAKRAYEPLVPDIAGLTTLCEAAVAAMGAKYGTAWTALVAQCKGDNRQPNIENILSKVRLKIDAIGGNETLLGLASADLRLLEKTVCATIAKSVSPLDAKIPDHTPHDDFATWIRKAKRTAPLEVFTTNYDRLLERAFEAARIPVFDAFVGTHSPFFFPECLEDDRLLPRSEWVRLWKLHGSVNWCLVKSTKSGGSGMRIAKAHADGGGELILPSNRKYDESRKQPFISYMDRMLRVLSVDHALLITCGFSFHDEHINSLVYGALDSRRSANVIALQFDDLREGDELAQFALHRPNLTVIGPNAGIISGMWGEWELAQPVATKTAAFMDIAFDSNAAPEDAGSPAAAGAALRGQMRLGDFNHFCRFLNTMRTEP